MPFKDLDIGSTHHEGDDCGEPAHNKCMWKSCKKCIGCDKQSGCGCQCHLPKETCECPNEVLSKNAKIKCAECYCHKPEQERCKHYSGIDADGDAFCSCSPRFNNPPNNWEKEFEKVLPSSFDIITLPDGHKISDRRDIVKFIKSLLEAQKADYEKLIDKLTNDNTEDIEDYRKTIKNSRESLKKELLEKLPKPLAFFMPDIFKDMDSRIIVPEKLAASSFNQALQEVKELIRKEL